jgi:hypothetical protein
MHEQHAEKPPARRQRLRLLRLLHRYGGLSAALLVIVISLTGLLLNHTERLGLANMRVQSTWLLNWYGIKPPLMQTYALNDIYVSHAGQRLYLNSTRLNGNFSRLCGAARIGDLVIISVDARLVLLETDGTLVEVLDTVHGIPGNICQIGVYNQQLVVDTGAGQWRADSTLSQWEEFQADRMRVDWTATRDLPVKLRAALLEDQRGDGLSLEQVILDIHSGQIIGMAGPWLSDAFAIVFILLALSGVWMWFKTRHSQ